MSKNILVADDDLTMMKLMSIEFDNRDLDVVVRAAENGEEAINAINRTKPDLLVLDLRMPKADGFAVLEHLQKSNPDVPVVVLTNYDTADYREKCTMSGVKEYIVKHKMPLQAIFERVTSYVG